MTGGDDVASPCTSVCMIDHATGLCVGCYRTLDEIAGWSDLSTEQKRTVLANLETRQARFGAAITARYTPATDHDGKR
jgi:predicted Fe-S protein YdhL (DUF1289 family)